jgi:hypothetical protein
VGGVRGRLGGSGEEIVGAMVHGGSLQRQAISGGSGWKTL